MVFAPGSLGQPSLRAIAPPVLVMVKLAGARSGNCGRSGGASTWASPNWDSVQLILMNNWKPLRAPLWPRRLLLFASLAAATLSPADAGSPPRQINLSAEVIEFLKLALPALIEQEQALKNPDTNTPPLDLEAPESLADKEFWLDVLDELDEILKYKWIESERAGFDIGMDRAIREWLHNHFTAWAVAHPPSTD